MKNRMFLLVLSTMFIVSSIISSDNKIEYIENNYIKHKAIEKTKITEQQVNSYCSSHIYKKILIGTPLHFSYYLYTFNDIIGESDYRFLNTSVKYNPYYGDMVYSLNFATLQGFSNSYEFGITAAVESPGVYSSFEKDFELTENTDVTISFGSSYTLRSNLHTAGEYYAYFSYPLYNSIIVKKLGSVFIDAEFYTNVPKNKPDNMLISLLLSKKRPTTVTSMVVPTC